MDTKHWNVLSHKEKIDILQKLNDDEIIQQFKPEDISEGEFRRSLCQPPKLSTIQK